MFKNKSPKFQGVLFGFIFPLFSLTIDAFKGSIRSPLEYIILGVVGGLVFGFSMNFFRKKS